MTTPRDDQLRELAREAVDVFGPAGARLLVVGQMVLARQRVHARLRAAIMGDDLAAADRAATDMGRLAHVTEELMSEVERVEVH